MVRASFELEKETKNTIRYAEKPEAGKPPVIGTILHTEVGAARADAADHHRYGRSLGPSDDILRRYLKDAEDLVRWRARSVCRAFAETK